MHTVPILRNVSSELGMEPADVPTPIDFLTMCDAQESESKAMLRPYREDFFAAFADELQAIYRPAMRILELGSGPGFLAHHLLSKIPDAQLTLLDYSAAMHELRHKRYAAALHAQVKGLLRAGGVYLVADHYFGEGAMQNDQLYMSLDEQRFCLKSSGYEVTDVLIKGGRSLYCATCLASESDALRR